jgi:hypothetical protein
LTALVGRLNDYRTAYETHRQIAPTVHDDADAVNTAPAALATSAATAAAITQLLTIIDTTNAHMAAVYPDIDNTGDMVHNPPGGSIDAVATATPATLASACTRTRTLCQKYMTHRARNDATNNITTSYHAAASSWTYTPTRPDSNANAADAINELLAMLHSHVTNKDHETGSAISYHTIADWRSRTDLLPRANADDVASIVQAKAIFLHLLSAHAGRTVHSNVTNVGYWQPTLYGVDRIHSAYFSAANDADAPAPANENEAAAKLVMLAGFRKV